MQFAEAHILKFLWIIPAIVCFFVWANLRRSKKLIGFVHSRLLSELVQNFSLHKYILKSLVASGVVAFSLLALARPQWGFTWQEIKQKGIDIIIAVDVSKSMLTQDIKPNRLERTKLAILDLIKSLNGDRVGLLAFAGDAYLVCPLTQDYGGFRLSLSDLNTDTIPRGGTNIERAIEEAVTSFDKTSGKNKVVVILTDGDNLEGDPLGAATKAKDAGIKIYTIGIGTSEGELVQIQKDDGSYEFLKDANGHFIKSRLNESLLEKIAQSANGTYTKATAINFGLDAIYDQQLGLLEKEEYRNKMEKKFTERFQWPLFLALLLLILETCMTTYKKEEAR